jgi:hypothetical protein
MLNRAYQGEALTSRSGLTADEAYGQNLGPSTAVKIRAQPRAAAGPARLRPAAP